MNGKLDEEWNPLNNNSKKCEAKHNSFRDMFLALF